MITANHRPHAVSNLALPRASTASKVWPLALLLLSGTASLIYQVLWIKQLSLIVGVEVYAVTMAVSAFFAGLALGGLIVGRLADRSARPLRLYAILEIGIAVLGVGSTLALARAAAPFATLEASVGSLAWLLPFTLVGIPAFLMGGTLPMLLRVLRPQAHAIGARGGALYAANTAGAVLGALLAPFLLIPLLGVRGAAMAAAMLNLLVALAALGLDLGGNTHPATAAAPDALEPMSSQARMAVWLYAMAGGIALGYEVVWSQAIVQFMSTRAFAFAIVLATYLTGLVLGSAISARHADRARNPWAAFGFLISAAGLVALLEFVLLGAWLPQLQAQAAGVVHVLGDNALATMSTRFVVAALCIVFVPTLLLGAAFPFVLRLSVDPRRVGRDVGGVVALNTLGGIAGSLLVGFVLVPAVGLVRTLAVLAVLAAGLGLFAAYRDKAGHLKLRLATVGVATMTVVAAVTASPDQLAELLAKTRGGTLTAYEESHGGTVAVIEQSSGTNRFHRLYIQGVSNSGDTMTSLRYMRLQALLPLLIHRGEPKSALVIGLGTGITGGALLRYPGLETRVVAELLPAVVRAVPNFKGNYGIGSDPRVEIRVRDGRRELLRSSRQYDLITLEPPPPSAAGVVNLYSSDFYRLAAARLQAGGMVAQWLPLPTQNADDTRALVRSFLDVFPHATLWTTELHEMMLVGSMSPIELDVPTIQRRFAQPEVAQALGEVGVDSVSTLLATWVTDRKGLARFAGEATPVTDDRPGIEYAPWVRREAFAETLNSLFEQITDPPLRGADAAFATEVLAERKRLITFYSASLYAYEGNLEAWQKSIGRVMQSDGKNPYYRWIVGAGAPASADR